jgi:hypothetical protein
MIWYKSSEKKYRFWGLGEERGGVMLVGPDLCKTLSPHAHLRKIFLVARSNLTAKTQKWMRISRVQIQDWCTSYIIAAKVLILTYAQIQLLYILFHN